ncbi:hypothetical protein ZIOFF_011221 [Zingiber officinale]|uniref:Uncharacterized protein n=1 Tax=Zingiber officinale TaxID=94328 RepID=A0A8J5HIB7_ZINOF|nr:hypothetical protein ZIOFF_011221 [Zingiber officinale]
MPLKDLALLLAFPNPSGFSFPIAKSSSLLLLLSLFFPSSLSATVTAQSSASPYNSSTVYDILQEYNLPPGILPDTVKSFSIASNGYFVIDLYGECYVDFEYAVYYAPRVSGFLSYSSISNIEGVQIRSYLIWYGVSYIKVDLPYSDFVYIQFGWVTRKLGIAQFQHIHSCRGNLSLFQCAKKVARSTFEDGNKYNSSRGAHLNLKRAEKARILVNKIPPLVDTLVGKTHAWEEDRGMLFIYILLAYGNRGVKPLFVIPHEKVREDVEEVVGDDTHILFITTPGQLAALVDDAIRVIATNTAALQLANARNKLRSFFLYRWRKDYSIFTSQCTPPSSTATSRLATSCSTADGRLRSLTSTLRFIVGRKNSAFASLPNQEVSERASWALKMMGTKNDHMYLT